MATPNRGTDIDDENMKYYRRKKFLKLFLKILQAHALISQEKSRKSWENRNNSRNNIDKDIEKKKEKLNNC